MTLTPIGFFSVQSNSLTSGNVNSSINLIERSLREICSIDNGDDGVCVTTHCLYPSNSLVRVTVRFGVSSVVASDDGGALGEALAAGIEIAEPDRLLRRFVKDRGLLLKSGVISTPITPIEATPVAILHVANVAKEAASWLYTHGGVKRRRDFRELLSAFLANTFKDQVAEHRIVGASNKSHKFANVILFPNGHKFIVDAVPNDPSSINSRVVANFDVKSTNDPLIEQRIIYDDEQSWSAADLKLLQIGATIVPFSAAEDVILRLAHQTRAVA